MSAATRAPGSGDALSAGESPRQQRREPCWEHCPRVDKDKKYNASVGLYLRLLVLLPPPILTNNS